MSGRNRRVRGGRGAGGFMGRLLSARLEEYGRSADLDDLEGAVTYLCHTFPEYRRQKQGAFSKQVARVAASLMEELRLQKIENKHLTKQQRRKNGDDSASNSTSEWSDRGEGSKSGELDSSDGDFNSDAAMDEDQNERLNSSLRTLYGISTANNRGAEFSSQRLAADGEPVKIVRSQEKEPSGGPGRIRGQAKKSAVEASGQETSSDLKKSKSQKSRKRDTDSGAVLAIPEKKKPKKTMSTGKHLTVAKTAMTVPKPVRYSDLGGIEDVLQDIKELIEYPLGHPEVYTWLGVEPPRGMLLHGPPGCGKTALANAIAHECGVPFFRVSAPEIVSGMSGESEAKIRNLFRDAAASAPSIIFIDEIDSIAQKRENAQREMERRIVAQLLTCMDDLSGMQTVIEAPNLVGDADGPGKASNPAEPESNMAQDGAGDKAVPPEKEPLTGGHVIVLGATNRPDALDPALRRAGRFDREISLGIPNEAARMRILNVMCKKLRLEGNFDFGAVARKTPGFVGADLEALAKEAAAVAITRIFADLENKKAEVAEKGNVVGSVDAKPEDMVVDGEGGGGGDIKKEPEPFKEEELSGLAITMDDFEAAIPRVQPSVRREGFTTTPDVTWADVGSLEHIREELSFAITQPILNPEQFESLGMSFACGVLLFGPPGCGKTLVAKAVANDAGANFMSIKGPELLNKYVGESERAVRQLFSRARAAKPCVLFFDEMDALAPRRGSDNQAAERVVNQLLTEMDGIDSREGVYLVAATNRPDIIDPALLRPGRLDKMLYVPLPDSPGRVSILEALLKKTPLGEGVSAKEIGLDQRCTGFSGADLAALVREACIVALKETIRSGRRGSTVVGRNHFEAALSNVKPSVSKEDQKLYSRMRATLRRSRAHIDPKVDITEG